MACTYQAGMTHKSHVAIEN